MGVHSAVRIAAALTLLLGLAAGCDVGVYGESMGGGGGGGGGGGADAGDDVAALTFEGQISEDTQVCLACHNDPPVGENNTTILANYAGISAVVDTADPAASALLGSVDPVNDDGVAEHAAYKDQARYDLYLEWIEAGAPEN